ncbi:MAG: hypothetical protein PUD20_01235 [bacterium]|nr:hypothetical protein [bacterium]
MVDNRRFQQQQYQEQKQEQQHVASQNTYRKIDFCFHDAADESKSAMKTEISKELEDAFMMSRSKEYMDILKKQVLSAMSDEEIKLIIAREIVRGGAESIEDVVHLKCFMEVVESGAEPEKISAEEQTLVDEMSEDDVADFLEMINASFAAAIEKEELKMKSALPELDKKAIDESYVLTRCPIQPSHDIHILPKKHQVMYYCHLTNHRLSPVFEEAKHLLFSGEAAMVHVYQGCAFVINADGEVTKRIDVVDEPMELVIRNGWEELP